MPSQPTQLIVLQRIRNRIIEVLELFSNDDLYFPAVSNLESWADWVNPSALGALAQPVFSPGELAEILSVQYAWDNVDSNATRNSPEWFTLLFASKQALRVFLLRGKMREH